MKKTLLFLISFLQFLISFSQNPNDVEHAYGPKPGFDGIIYDIKKQPDGKIIVAGSFEKFQAKFQHHIIRLNIDGSKDDSFDIGGGFFGDVYCISLQNDGKVLVGGVFTSFNGISQFKLVRLNTNGSIDNSFKTGKSFSSNNSSGGRIYSITIQPDGKIIVGGDFTKYNGISQNYLIRLNQDGSKDNSFDIGTGFDNIIRTIKIQEDGKLLIGGIFTSYKGLNSNGIIRLNSDGTKDLTFDIGKGFQGFHGYNTTCVYSILQQSDGKILVGGDYTYFNGSNQKSLVRLNIDGSKDNSFDIGSGFNSAVVSLAIDTNKKVLAGGSFSTFQNNIKSNYLIRLNIDGSKDDSLDLKTGFSSTVFSIDIQNDDKLIIGGYFVAYQGNPAPGIIRLNTNGDKDISFNLGDGFNSYVRSISIQEDGKLIVSGNFSTYQSTNIKYFLRLKTDGDIDKSFNTGAGFNKAVSTSAVQSDQKILVGGGFDSYNGSPEPHLIRLNSDGTKDITFNIGSGFNNSITSLFVQKDGKILVQGLFTSFQGNPQKYLMRLNQDGSKDTSFNIYNDLVTNELICLQNDEKILIRSKIENDKFILIRLNNDGSLDNTFNMTSIQSKISSIAQQNDGKILIGSQFDFYNGDPDQYLIRLNSDGTKDLTFNNSNEFFSTNTLFPTEVTNITIQNDGKIIAGGFFPNAFGLRSGVIRLNSDGSADNTFNLKTLDNDGITSIIVEPNGKIVIGGRFELYNGDNGDNDNASAFLIRLKGTETNLSNEQYDIENNPFSLWPNPVKNTLNINSLNETNYSVKIYDLLGRLIYTNENVNSSIDVSSFNSGVYLIKIKAESGKTSQKFIKI